MLFTNLKIKRLLFTAASFVFSCSAACGQGGFNLRIPIEGNTGFQSVYSLSDTSYIVAAWSRDTLTNDHLDFELLKYDFVGEQIARHSFSNPSCIVNIPEDANSDVKGIFVQFEQSVYDDKYAHTLYWFDDAADTLFTRIVQSPYKDSLWSEADFLFAYFAALSKDSCLFYATGIWKLNSTGNDVCIKKFSPTGDELWTYIYATYAEVDACYALLPQADGGVIAGIAEGIWDENPYQYTRFTKINSLGNEEWVIDSRDLFEDVYRVECTIQDSNTIVACGAFKSLQSSGYGKSKIIKFDFDGNLIWQREYGEYTDYNVYWEKLTNIVQTCDSNYVVGGDWYTYTPTPDNDEDDENRWDAYIVKLNRENGEIIWERNFHYLDVPNDQHKMVDMKATLDGGIIFCGESRDATPTAKADYEIEYPRQQGWLVKLDECGCLVPGCDSLCSYVGCHPPNPTDTTFFTIFGSHFIIGPNPATQFINIYVGLLESLNLESLHFTLHDAQGKLAYEFSPTQIETTYMLSTEKFASGLYVLSLSDGERVLQQQKIVVEK